ncbi:MAG: FctA domain-containing protein [Collinsella aerofaciens]|nr:FctA domain-containing protein [Collinsella aerofaciens]
MKANSEKTKQKKATRRVLAGVLCGASVLSLVLSLVMPPISQAIANDAQVVSTEETVMGGGSSSESTDVDDTNNGDTENQNSDETESGESNTIATEADQPSDDAGVGDAVQPAEEGANGEGAIALAADNESTHTISNGAELNTKLLNKELRNKNGATTFELAADIEYDDEIQLEGADTNITLNLNGFKIKHTSSNQPLFSITGGATLTVRDGKQVDPTVTPVNRKKMNGNLASIECDNSYIPNKLTYYVTESVAKGTGTTETLKEYQVDIKGAIVACGGSDNLKLVNLYKTGGKAGTFNLESGAITQQQNSIDQNYSVNSLVYAEGGSVVNMSGGYVCGATSMNYGAGIELGTKNNSGATLNLTGGVIAGNYAPNGGGVNAYGSTINMTGGTGGTTGGTISGNGTFENLPGYGAGICAQNSDVTVSDGYVTNNNCQFDYMQQGMEDKHKGNGCHGGGGIAAFNGGSLTINGGYITGNYSAEAGGGIYAGAWGQALSTFKFSGGTIASNVAQNSEGGGIRIAAPTVGLFEVLKGSHAYITNNTTNTTNDWGGGGVFVQGYGDNVQAASLKIYNALITKNDAQGFGGGFAACPTGETAITNTDGIAIFGNTDKNGEHRSGGTHGKNDDADKSNDDDSKGEITEGFKNAGHRDLFLIRDQKTSNNYIAAVTGQMLVDGAANWTGMIDGQPTTIGKYDGAQAKYMIGLDANPSEYDQGQAVSNARLFITGNTSNVHGGGIMTNGNVVAGSTQEVKVHHEIKLSGTKALTGLSLTKGEFSFQLLKPNESGKGPYFDKDDKLHFNDCPEVCNPVTNDASGDFVFDLGGVYSTGMNVYYLVEDPDYNHVDGVDYDKTIYRIELTTGIETRSVLGINYIDYSVTNVTVTKLENKQWKTITPSYGSDGSIKITDGNTGNTFTNAYVQGSWTPQMTKKVDGGEMKAFTFELANADDVNFTKPERATINPDSANVKTDKNGNATSTVNFKPRYYKLTDLKNGSKTFTYYVREKDDSSTYSHYKFDKSVYKLNVTMAVQKDGRIVASKVTYTKIKDRDGNEVTNDTDHDLTDTSIPTFTNTYSTSLPLSGMSGVTLTYLAGAAVLCAAAAWMHIRRKANAKGGKRRE